MAKRKHVEKLGEVIGNNRPLTGVALLVLGLYLSASMLGYSAGQDILFKHYFEPLLPSTEVIGTNFCGKLGATLSLTAVLLAGAAAYMIPVYVMWYAACCFRRRAALITRTEFAAVVTGVLSLSVTAAVLQSFFGSSAPTQSATFPSSWGGKFGFAVYGLLKPYIDNFGCIAIFSALYFVSLGVVFVESPAAAIADVGVFLKFCLRALLALLKLIFVKLPKRIFSALISRKNADEDEPAVKEVATKDKKQPAPEPKSDSDKQAPAEEPENILEDQSVSEAELRDLANFARDLGSRRENADQNSSILDDVVEAEKYVAPEDEVAAVNFTGVKADFAKIDSEPSEDAPAANGEQPEQSAEEAKVLVSAKTVKITSAPDTDANDTPDISDAPRAEEEQPSAVAAVENAEEEQHGEMDETVKLGEATSEESITEAAVAAAPKDAKPAKAAPEKLEFKVINAAEEEDGGADELPDNRRAASPEYVFPSIDLLSAPEKRTDIPPENYAARMQEIIDILGNYGVSVIPDNAYSGPVITRYEVKPAKGVKISKIESLEKEITAGMKADKVRMIAPVPGHGTVGIEVPNLHRQNVSMSEVLRSRLWRETKYEIPIALGKDATGEPIVANLKKMTHALIAGSTNSGKSVCINTIIISMLYKMTPDDLRLIMIDPKMVELQGYNSVPHMLIPVVVDVKKAAAALKWLTNEMMRRYTIFNKTGVRNIDGFNAKILKDKAEMQRADEEFAQMSPEERQAALAAKEETAGAHEDIEIPTEKLPYIVCIIDELADLMSVVGKDVEIYIARITQLARAAGIHMIIATQRPDVKVITGKIKNNLPTRIAFKVTSQIDSRTILDRKGAETLIGQGDMLFLNNGAPDIVRAQGAYIPDSEIEAVVEALKVNGPPQYAEDVQAEIDADGEDEDSIADGDGGKYGDPMTVKAILAIKASGKASTSLLQRKLGIGYGRAARIMDELETRGIISPADATGKRELYLDNL